MSAENEKRGLDLFLELLKNDFRDEPPILIDFIKTILLKEADLQNSRWNWKIEYKQLILQYGGNYEDR
ncbi:MAG: hypothetical protein OdinLCB4_007090 [Candidatus Odinarchaeum yellowstonii]|uniref:Uncharacterized protein n=1 Tax=Odinarchaeota yellowstonii (strain LCB_4) TaxID=1841599 RepID=A0AAF0IBS3_ODILC|nr:MAG: hypothetical protein OdinLCB4_007090 [Candidatus Odinarchaeum yellowstonii]